MAMGVNNARMQISPELHKDATWLAFDVSVVGASVALAHGGRLYTAIDGEPGKQSARLVPMIEGLLAQAGITYTAIERLVTTVGPGSFTGIRIGLAAAQGLVAATGMGVSILTTLEAIALRAWESQVQGEVWATLNAGKGEVFCQLFHVKQDGIRAQGQILLLSPDHFAAHIAEGQAIMGNTSGMLPPPCLAQYRAGAELPLASCFVRAGLPLAGAEALVPLYIRAPDAKLPAKA